VVRRVPRRAERVGGPSRHASVDLHGRDKVAAEPMGEQRGGVPGPGPHLQHPVPVADIEVFQHPDDQAGQGGGRGRDALRRARGIGAAQLGDPGDVLVRQVEPVVLTHLLGRDRLPPVRPRTRHLPVDPPREEHLARNRLDGRSPGTAAQVSTGSEFVREPTTPSRASAQVSPDAHVSLSGSHSATLRGATGQPGRLFTLAAEPRGPGHAGACLRCQPSQR
jgi:hypothetical protein